MPIPNRSCWARTIPPSTGGRERGGSHSPTVNRSVAGRRPGGWPMSRSRPSATSSRAAATSATAPGASVKPEVQALLDRAAKEPPGAARATLNQARARAERAKGRVGLLAVAATAQRLGLGRQQAADYAGAEQYYRLAVAIREKQ